MTVFNSQGKLNAESLKDALQTIAKYASVLEGEDLLSKNRILKPKIGQRYQYDQALSLLHSDYSSFIAEIIEINNNKVTLKLVQLLRSGYGFSEVGHIWDENETNLSEDYTYLEGQDKPIC